jgi:sugar lactone lactonase YvrE
VAEIELVLSVNDELGEGPLWNTAEQRLYWVDIESRLFHRLNPLSGEHEIIPVGEKIGALAFRQQGGLVMATDHGFAFFDPQNQRLEHIGDPEADKPHTSFNDGKVDRAGRFWAGTLGNAFQNNLYRLDPDLSIHSMETGVDISNGIGWSPDNRTMYFTDSTPSLIFAYDFDLSTGNITNRRVFVDRGGKPGVPDGLTVDAEGFIWSAVWEGWCVERYDPDGKLERTVKLPVQFPTSVAFGGRDLDELYITSAVMEIPKEKRAGSPDAGGLFRVKGLTSGIEEPLFGG